MTREVFTKWLLEINRFMKSKKRRILLFIDNCSAHTDLPTLSNIRIKFLPPNTTSKLQPLDQGFIKNFESLYRKEWFEKLFY